MKKAIKKVAVLGSGIMGAGIACHFANIGIEVLLLDLADTKSENKNKFVNDNFTKAIKNKPSPLYLKEYKNRIETGNFDDDLHKIASCDWIVEVIIENLEIKQQLYEKVEVHRSPETIISSNTSGIPIHFLAKGRSDDFRKHFCGTHFFNPPRYLKLLEIIPTPDTLPEVLEFVEDFGKRFLGKTTVICNDTPAFIANRIGVFSILTVFNLVEKHNLSFTEIDKLTGTLIGRPKSATFRTVDVVGLDTLIHVYHDLQKNCTDDKLLQTQKLPEFISKMYDQKLWGVKTGSGFYKKEKRDGKSQILSLNTLTLAYEPSVKAKFPELQMFLNVPNGIQKLKSLVYSKTKIADFYKSMLYPIFSYSSFAIPDISSTLKKLDDSIKGGFGWNNGVFETWDELGVKEVTADMKKQGYTVAPWVNDMIGKNIETFYTSKDFQRCYYLPETGDYKVPDPSLKTIELSVLREQNTLWKNDGATITDLGNGIINLEFHTKMNAIGSEIIEGVNVAINMAEEKYKGLVIYNEGEHFSAGANIGMIYMLARDQEFEELDMVIRQFQSTMMRIKYSSIPVIAAVHGYVFGGGCELTMHADKVLAHAETYMGLVEMGVGLIPAGGGSKEFALRLSDELKEGDVKSNAFRQRFLTIGQASVSTSALEAFELGYLRKGTDEYIVCREQQLIHAKKMALSMAHKGYLPPIKRKDIMVLGSEGQGLVLSGASNMAQGEYITEYEQEIAKKLGNILCGGNITGAGIVSEQYLLDLERRAFIELCSQQKTLERLHSFITTGKMIRN